MLCCGALLQRLALRENLWFGQIVLGGFTLHPLVLMFAVAGSLMISRIRIPKP